VPGVGDGKVELGNDLVVIEKRTRVDHTRTYTPNVIEPSFGLGRIFYALCEHVYWTRPEDVSRAVLSFPPSVAPIPVAVLPLSSNVELNELVKKLSSVFRKAKIHHVVDSSGVSIGRRYSRQDQIGTAFGITVDFDSLKNNTFTLRERDSTEQIRGSQEEILAAIRNVLNGDETWGSVAARLPKFEGQVAEDEAQEGVALK
jgi:glycyl-tRNA synthetase